MKTSVIEVREMLSVFSVAGVEKRIGEVPGVASVTVNYAAESATVRYDETRLEVTDIKSAVRQSEYESAAPATASTGQGHEGDTALAVPTAAAVATAPPLRAAPVASSAPEVAPKSSPVAQDSVSPATAPKSAPNADAPAAPAGDETKGKDKN